MKAKKLMAALLSAAMAATSAAVPVFAEEPDNKTITVDASATEEGVTTLAAAIEKIQASDDKTGWTIQLKKSSDEGYAPVEIPAGVDNLTIEGVDANGAAASDKPVIKFGYADSPTYTGGTYPCQNSGGMVIDGKDVTFKNIKFTGGDYVPEGSSWYRAAIGYSNEYIVERGKIVVNNCDFEGSENAAYAIYAGSFDAEITGCTFNNFNVGFYTENVPGGTEGGIKITGNTFTKVNAPVSMTVYNFHTDLAESPQDGVDIEITGNTIGEAKTEGENPSISVWDYGVGTDADSTIKSVNIADNTTDDGVTVDTELTDISRDTEVTAPDDTVNRYSSPDRALANVENEETFYMDDADGNPQVYTKEDGTHYSETDENGNEIVHNINVAKTGDQEYRTLQGAIDAVTEDGGEVTILPGSVVNGETITINKSITIKGGEAPVPASVDASTLTAELTDTRFTVTESAEFTLENLKITGFSDVNVTGAGAFTMKDCDVDVSINEKQGNNSRRSFVYSTSESSQGVKFDLEGNHVAVPKGEAFAAAVFTWSYIDDESCFVDNVFGAEDDRYKFIVIKSMNAMDGATVTIERNTFYGTNQSNGFYAVDLYQNNSRENSYKVVTKDNKFDLLNAKPGNDLYAYDLERNGAGEGGVALFDSGSTVNDEPITTSDILEEDYSPAINYGVDVTYDETGSVIGGTFGKPIDDAFIKDYCPDDADVGGFKNSDGSYTITDSANITENVTLSLEGGIVPAEEEASLFSLGAPTKDELDSNNYIFPIKLKADENRIISRYMSAELTLNAEQGEYAVRPCENASVVDLGEVKDEQGAVTGHKYGLYMDGEVDGKYGAGITSLSGSEITIGYVEILGYGPYSISVVDGVIRTAEAHNNIVDSYTTTDENLFIADERGKVAEGNKEMEMRDLTVQVMFPNTVLEQSAAYTDMQIEINSEILSAPITAKLGNDADNKVTYEGDNADVTKSEIERTTVDGYDGYTFTVSIPEKMRYTLTFTGAGYRTYSVDALVEGDTTVTVWNNVMDNSHTVVSSDGTDAEVTFLAGDIIEDNTINLYDLSAAVAYFGKTGMTTDAETNKEYIKYDLNRDGAIDSKDIAMVLVSWNK